MALINPMFADPNQQQAGPDELRRRQALATQLLKNGADVSNVRSPMQAFSNVFQSGVGAYLENKNQNQLQQQALARVSFGNPKGGLF